MGTTGMCLGSISAAVSSCGKEIDQLAYWEAGDVGALVLLGELEQCCGGGGNHGPQTYPKLVQVAALADSDAPKSCAHLRALDCQSM